MVEQTGSRRWSAEAIAFERYVRTGIRSSAQSRSIEVKFNPWHDPANGRFTFSGQGRYSGAGSTTSADAPRNQRQSRANATGDPDYGRFDPRDPRNRTIYVVKPGDSLTKIAQLRKGLTIDDLAWLNGFSKEAPPANRPEADSAYPELSRRRPRCEEPLHCAQPLYGDSWRAIAA